MNDACQTEEEIKERDDAIAILLKQLMFHREQLVNISFESVNSSQWRKESFPLMKEVQKLRQEAEVFAGQVIELDAEIESFIRAAVEARDTQIVELQQELQTLRERQPPRPPTPPRNHQLASILILEAEIDGLQAANSTTPVESNRNRDVSQ